MINQNLQQNAARAVAAAPVEPGTYYHLCQWQRRLQILGVPPTQERYLSSVTAPGDAHAQGGNVPPWQLWTKRVQEFDHRLGITLYAWGRRCKPDATLKRPKDEE